MESFDELEQQAEARIAAKLGRYEKAATMIGVVFAVLLVVVAFLMLPGGAIAIPLFLVTAAIVLLWLVKLLRTARAAIGAVPFGL